MLICAPENTDLHQVRWLERIKNNPPIPFMYGIFTIHLVDFYGRCRQIYYTWIYMDGMGLEIDSTSPPKKMGNVSGNASEPFQEFSGNIQLGFSYSSLETNGKPP